MRRLYSITTMLCSLLFVGCSALFSTTTLAPNDLYRTDNREVVVSRLEAQAALEQERIAEWEALQAAANASQGYNTSGYSSIVADSYESAYARRLNGFNSPTYKLPSSYYNLLGNSTMYYATAYDPSLYNIMVSGDEVWVEPKYITSMFGSWGATNLSFGIYASPWNYGWGYYADPFYYSWWGYPRYSWYDWNWNICYNPWHYDWYWGYPAYPHYHHHHHYHPGHGPGHGPSRPPQHRPTVGTGGRPDHGYVTTGSGASAGPIYGNLNGGRGSSGSRYTSPTSNRNYGSTTITTRPGRGGTISTGVNTNSQYQPSGLTVGGSTRPATNGGTSRSTTTVAGGGSNFRQNSTSTGTTGGSRSTGSVSSGTTSTSRGGSVSSGSSSGSYRGTSSSRGSYGGSSTGGSSSSSSSSSRSGGSTSSRR